MGEPSEWVVYCWFHFEPSPKGVPSTKTRPESVPRNSFHFWAAVPTLAALSFAFGNGQGLSFSPCCSAAFAARMHEGGHSCGLACSGFRLGENHLAAIMLHDNTVATHIRDPADVLT